MPTTPPTITTLSAMVMPALLILACASLLLAVSQRLGRVIDRTRELSEQFEALTRVQAERAEQRGKRALLYRQLGRLARRARLLQWAATCLYLSLSLFVATSLATGLTVATDEGFTWLPIVLGLTAAALLLYASLVLIAESRIALGAVEDEVKFVNRLRRRFVRSEIARLAVPERASRRMQETF